MMMTLMMMAMRKRLITNIIYQAFNYKASTKLHRFLQHHLYKYCNRKAHLPKAPLQLSSYTFALAGAITSVKDK